MIEVVYYVAASLDGYIATEDGRVDWLPPIEPGGEDYGSAGLLASVDALIMGARTYEFCLSLGAWPYPKHPTWVFAHGGTAAPPAVTITSATPGEGVAAMERAGARRAWLVGGGRLAASFRAEGLLARYVVSVVPVVLGRGIPMLAPAPGREGLALVASRVYPDGIVQLEYRRA